MGSASRSVVVSLIVAVIAALCAVVLVLPTTASATPDQPEQPRSSADVQRELGELALQNTQLVEAFDQAQVQVSERQAAAEAAAQEATTASAKFEQVREVLGRTAAARYEGGSFSATGALLTSSSGHDYLQQLETLSMISTQTAQVVNRLTDTKRIADESSAKAKSLLDEAVAKRDALAQDREKIQKEIDKYTQLLGMLTASERQAYQQRTVAAVNTAKVVELQSAFATQIPAALPDAAAQAVRFALAQVGKPYVFGASGPSAYDCSGLTGAAWASAGVSLPHSAAMQYNYGHRVSFAELRPGDLMFFYRPIGHVTIYIGDGLMVSAPQTGENVSVVPANQFGSQFVGATRLTG